MPIDSSGCTSGATKVTTVDRLESPLCTRTVGWAGPGSNDRSWASDAVIAKNRLSGPPPSATCRTSTIFWCRLVW